MNISETYINSQKTLIKALAFSARKHETQIRKGLKRKPYINHPIRVVELLSDSGVYDMEILSAALLHDVLEDTKTSKDELQNIFGNKITSLVVELTDDTSIPLEKRKEWQVKQSINLSIEAKNIRIADKTSNVEDLLSTRLFWSRQRKINYINWARKIVINCKGSNEQLGTYFFSLAAKGLEKLSY